MNGPHDLGGAQGFGPLPFESGPTADAHDHRERGESEPLFHGEWERRVLALTLAMGATGQWNIDQSRAVRESLPPARYLSASYYEIWLEALQRLMLRRGLVTPAELADGVPREPPVAVRVLAADRVTAALAAGSPTARPGAASRFAVGQPVRARELHPPGHVRLPRYVRGRPGIVEACHGPHVFADRHAAAGDEAPEPLYTVRFAARDLWGTDTTADAVCVDCWESYLEPLAASSAATGG